MTIWGKVSNMKPIRLYSAAEQVAVRLREEIVAGVLWGEMPGIHQLAADLVVNHKTVETALGILEKEGLLERRGAGRRRGIMMPKKVRVEASRLRIAILNYDPPGNVDRYIPVLQQALIDAGHAAFFSGKSLNEMGMNRNRVIAHVESTKADAWVVVAGSVEVLEWFAEGDKPAFALFGRRGRFPIAAVGPEKSPMFALAARRLIELGHRRIVLLTRSERRLPEPGVTERAFLREMESHGVATGPYNLPDWEESAAGFHARLASLFHATPPTALIVDESPFFFAAMQFLMACGLRVPSDVSLICANGDPRFAWFQPMVSHIDWDSRPVIRRVVRWAANIGRGKEDRRQSFTKAVFVEGGTIGPAAE